jgi:UDP-N-acetyl-D-mannosaminuronic acid dehydrogenase
VEKDLEGMLAKRVSVVGLGYTGLPTAAVLASRGYQVHGVDVNPLAVETINSGRAHIVEPDLDMLVRAAVTTGRLEAHAAPRPSDIFILCVPTPCTHDHQPDLHHLIDATESISPHLAPGNLVVLESTSPPGTTERLAALVRERTGIAEGEIHFAHAPERVLPGRVLREVVENDRVIGGLDEASTELCASFYRTFVRGEIHLTDARTAETVKLVENAYRDVNIAFANELSLLADELNLDVWELIELANRHPRVDILRPGPGVGGHCIAVDPWFLVSSAPGVTNLIRTARQVNDNKPGYVAQRVLRRAERFRAAKIACLGLAYKPNVDDLRESAAIEVVRELVRAGTAEVRVCEPYIRSHPEFRLSSADQAIDGADIVVFLVAHDHFRKIPRKALEEKIIIDVCGVYR